ncbi:MAG: hypothetical protein HZA51_10455 [Planctomycetes bacterium]|nr:hypothetical protein [Planctomycetota bacterium]
MLNFLIAVVVLFGGSHFASIGLPEAGFCLDGKNEYYSLIAIRKKSCEATPLPERKKKATVLAARVRKYMEGCKFASFTLRNNYFWTIEGSKESSRPLREWALQEEHVADVFSTHSQVAVHVRINSKPLYHYFLGPREAREFKYPRNGVSGQTATYKPDGYFHLRDGVEPRLNLDCGIAAFLTPYGGPQSTLAEPYEASMKMNGEWLGTVKGPRGVPCDLVCVTSSPNENDGQWDYYLIGEQGLIIQKYRLCAYTEYEKFNRLVWRESYEKFSTAPLEPSDFVPAPDLLELSKNWKDVSEKVIAAQAKEARAQAKQRE